MIIFQVSLTFDPKEILKILCQIYILMKKVIIPRKIHETIKSYAKHTQASAANLLHIRIGNLGWCKWGHCKNEARQMSLL